MSPEKFSLTLSQSDIYFDQLKYPNSPLYNVGGYIKITNVDVERLKSAHASLVTTEEIFGLRIVSSPKGIQQYLSNDRSSSLEYLDFSEKTDALEEAGRFQTRVFESPFDVENTPMFAAYLIKVSEHEYRYLAIAHHLMMDGFGFMNWAVRLAEIYAAEGAPNRKNLDWKSVSNKDISYLESKKYKSDRSYWLEQFLKKDNFLPSNYHSKYREHEVKPSARNIYSLSPAQLDKLSALGKVLSTGRPQLFLSLLTCYFSLAYEKDELVYGLPLHNRRNASEKSMLGVFTSISPLSIQIGPQDTFADVTAKIADKQKSMLRHQRYPIGDLLRELGLSAGTESIYDLSYNYLNLDKSLEFDGIGAELIYLSHNREATPLSVNVWEDRSGAIDIQFDYSCSHFVSSEIDLLYQRLSVLLKQVFSEPNSLVSRLQILYSKEVTVLGGIERAAWKRDHAETPNTKTFEDRANENPNKAAVVCGTRTVTYKQLDAQADHLAKVLKTAGVREEVVVGIFIEQSYEVILGMLAILRAGGGFLALDPNYSTDRLNHIIADSGLNVVLTTDRYCRNEIFEENQDIAVVNLSRLDSFSPSRSLPKTEPDLANQTSSNLAYIIYTSGSTGIPKGVMIERGGFESHIRSVNNVYNVTPDDRILQLSSMNFDPSIEQIFIALLNGATSYVCENKHMAAEELIRFIAENQISVVDITPAHLKVLLNDPHWNNLAKEKLRLVIVGGEALTESVVNDWRMADVSEHAKLVNAYGPTEATITSMVHTVDRVANGAPPIGKLLENRSAYILTSNLNFTPNGLVGELYLGGIGIARGYLNLPDVTSSNFISNPFCDDKQDVLYKTGDLVRYLPNGDLEFIGRIDEQVKIRGFRVELGEVEHHLNTSLLVSSALVTTTKTQTGSLNLLAYVIPINDSFVEKIIIEKQLKTELKNSLPAHMVPTRIVVVDEWPLTQSGEIDKQALPDHNYLPVSVDVNDVPTTSSEVALAAILVDLLNVDSGAVGVSSNFFDLGGNSLLAMQFVSRIRQVTNKELSIKSVFEAQDIQQLAASLDDCEPESLDVSLIKIDRSKEDISASVEQQRLWLIDQIEGGSQQYNMPSVFKVLGPIDIDSVEQALSMIVQRHEPLRTTLVSDGHNLSQVIQADTKFTLVRYDYSELKDQDKDRSISELVEANRLHKFDLARDLMFRACFVQLGNDFEKPEGLLLFNMHHICFDGWSVNLFIQEFITNYESISHGNVEPFDPLEFQYADYANWQKRWLNSPALQQQAQYWDRQLESLPAVHSLPLDFPRPEKSNHKGIALTGHIPPELVTRLDCFAKQEKVTRFMVLHALFGLVLSRHSGANDVVIGTPIANRMLAEFEPLIGLFVNTLVLRTSTDYKHFSDYLTHVKETNLDAQRYRNVPFDYLVERCGVSRSLNHSPLIQILLSLDEGEDADFGLPDIDLTFIEPSETASKFDLEVTATVTENGIDLNWLFDCSLFKRERISKLNDQFIRLLGEVLSAPAAKICDLNMLSQSEHSHLTQALNRTAVRYDQGVLPHERFESTAMQRPESIALKFDARAVSYKELNEEANQLAHYLRAAGITTNELVGICISHSVDMVVAILGVWKAGAAYVPLDPTYPQARLEFMIANAKVKSILTQTGLVDGLNVAKGVSVTELDSEAYLTSVQDCARTNLSRSYGQDASSLAYVIFTSGSTGQPKASLVINQGIQNLLAWYVDDLGLDANEQVLLVSSFCFDLTQKNIIGALCAGGTLHLQSGVFDPNVLVEYISNSGITHLNLTPSSFETLIDANLRNQLRSVRRVVLGGEPIRVNRLMRLPEPRPEFVNSYGPTECSDVVAFHVLDHELSRYERSVPIGRPIRNTSLFILDQTGQVAPMGAIGELHIGGAGVGNGYLGQAKLTASKFIDSPFSDSVTDRLYKTGDLVRYLDDGNIEFVGRTDDQLKIRGFRIELSEIEVSLNALAAVESSVVISHERDAEDIVLVAYVVKDNSHLEIQNGYYIDSLRDSLEKIFPDYMVPSTFEIISEWPLTPNGKIDKKALPTPSGADLSNEFTAPTTDTETVLVKIWAQMLGLSADKLSVNADFFKCGGHSLLAIRMIAAIRDHFDRELAVNTIFESPTIRKLAIAIDSCDRSQERLAIAKAKRTGNLAPTSYDQQRLWLIDQLEGGSSHYNMSVAFRIEGDFKTDIAQQAITRIITRHEPLRTVFVEQGNGPLQVIQSEFEFNIVQHDLSRFSSAEQHRHVASLIEQDSGSCFDLGADLMVRATYIHLSDDEHAEGVLLFNTHHIASDGWSVGILISEFVQQYESILLGNTDSLTPLEIEYADYAHWQRQWLTSNVLEEQLDYWQQQLENVPVLHSLPLDFSRPEEKSNSGGVVVSKLSRTLTSRLNTFARDNDLTLFMLLHAAFALVLSRHSNHRDIVIGTPVANRMRSEFDPLIGLFVNTLVLRTNTDFLYLPDYLEHVRQINLDAQANQDVPFDRLVEHVHVSRSVQHTPLFQIAFTMNTTESADLSIPGLRFSEFESDHAVAKFDLDVVASSFDDGIEFSWVYDTSLFTSEHIETLSSHLLKMLGGMIQSPQARLSNLPLLSQSERDYLVFELNQTNVEYPQQQLIHELFEQKAADHPTNIAVVYNEHSLTYKDLNEASNKLANLLRKRGVTPETLVGICLDRSIEMISCTLAVLKAGGAYVPLDPNYPKNRIEYMLEDSDLEYLITNADLIDMLSIPKSVSVLDLSSKGYTEELANYANANPPRIVEQTASSLAYVLYTSGSTGQPKGVLVEHDGLVNLTLSLVKEFDLTSQSRLMQLASFSFDAATWDMSMALSAGSALHIVSQQTMLSPSLLGEYVRDNAINYSFIPPVLLGVLDIDDFECLKTIAIGGESTEPSLAVRWAKGRRLYNAYGPTENTVVSTISLVDEHDKALNIGHPINNVTCFVLGHDHELLPFGSTGELYLGGAGLARGYLNRSELTQTNFISNPFSKTADFLYKTGDLVRYLSDGKLKFVGRVDEQVKIRGIRIELGEIESQLNQCDRVHSSLVIAQGESSVDKALVAYVVLDQQGEEGGQDMPVASSDLVAGIRHSLLETLPAYMVPNEIVVLDSWPISSNGKIDRARLPKPIETDWQDTYLAPNTKEEKILATIWASLLHLDAGNISSSANFFELGGNSLHVANTVHILAKEHGLAVNPKAFFKSPRLSDVALKLGVGEVDGVFSIQHQDKQTAIPLSSSQRRIWFVEQKKPGTNEHNIVGGVRLRGEICEDTLQKTVEYLFHRHAVLRTKIEIVDGIPYQSVDSEREPKIDIHDFSRVPKLEREAKIFDLVQDHGTSAFDIYKSSMVSILLIKETANDYSLYMNFHHLVCDGWSVSIFVNDFVEKYEKILLEDTSSDESTFLSYADYALWQEGFHQSSEYRSQQDFWRSYLLNDNTKLDLPFKADGGDRTSTEIEFEQKVVESKYLSMLKELAKRNGGTLFNIVHSCLALLLARISGQRDLNIGIPVAGRNIPGLDRIMGVFINNLPIRSQVDLSMPFESYLREQIENAGRVLSNQDIPFEEICSVRSENTDENSSALFDVFLNVLNLPPHRGGNRFFELGMNGSAEVEPKFGITLYVEEINDGLEVRVQFDATQYSSSGINEFQNQLVEILQQVALDSQKKLAEYTLLNQPNVTQGFLSPPSGIPDLQAPVDIDWPGSVQKLFCDQAAANTDKTALEFNGKSWTYGSLDSASNHYARLLETEGIRPGDIVGIIGQRNDQLVIAILSVLKAGAAFLILAETPVANVARQIELCRPKALLTLGGESDSGDKIKSKIHESDVVVIDIKPQNNITFSHSSSISGDKPIFSKKDDLAYIAFTSGSEGEPKIVEGRHRSLTAYMAWMADEFNIEDTDRFGMLSGLLHDPLQRDIFTPLCLGGTLCIPNELEITPTGIKDWLVKHRVSILNVTPSLADYLFSDSESGDTITSMSVVFFAGEPLSLTRCKKISREMPNAHLVNLYGATETCRALSYFSINQSYLDNHDDSQVLPLGRGVASVQLILLNEALMQCGVGEVGQIGIRSSHLSLGYRGDHSLTNKKFIQNPLSTDSEDLIYLTGDNGRYSLTGDVEYLGRADRQVKIRGYRVDLNEVEQTLLCHPSITQVVAVLEDSDIANLLVYIRFLPQLAVDNPEVNLKKYLKDLVPDYMIPSGIFIVDEFPLTPNGKVDVAALRSTFSEHECRVIIGPQNKTEESLLAIWRELLGREDICINDDFFHVGGHSLLVTRMFVRIKSLYHIDLDYSDFFENNSIKIIAKKIDDVVSDNSAKQKKPKKKSMVI